MQTGGALRCVGDFRKHGFGSWPMSWLEVPVVFFQMDHGGVESVREKPLVLISRKSEAQGAYCTARACAYVHVLYK